MGRATPSYEEFSKKLEGLAEPVVEQQLKEGRFGPRDAEEYRMAERLLRERQRERETEAVAKADARADRDEARAVRAEKRSEKAEHRADEAHARAQLALWISGAALVVSILVALFK